MVDSVNTVNSGGGADYTTIQAAIDDSDFTGIDRWVIEIQNNGAYAENLTLGGSTGTPSATSHIFITATDAAYHAGVPGTGARVSPTGADHAIEITENFAHIHKLLVEMSTGSSSSNECVRITNADPVLIERCILDGQARNRTTNDGDCVYNDDDDEVIIYNSLLIESDRTSVDFYQQTGIFRMEFCTLYGHSITESSAAEIGGLIVPRNTGSTDHFIYNSVIADSISGDDWDLADGTGTTTAANNASEDTSAPGTSAVTSITPANEWTDPANFDFTILDTDAAIYLAGTDRSGSKPDSRVDATIDIAGTTRPATPSIGAFELAAAGPDRSITAAQDAFLPTQSAAATVRNDITAAQDSFLATQAAAAAVRNDVTAAQDAFLATQAAALVAAETRTITSAQDAFLPTQAAAATVLADIAAAQDAFLPTQASSLAVRADLTADQFGFLPTQNATLALGDTRTVAADQDAFLPTQVAAAEVLVQAAAVQSAFLATQTAAAEVLARATAAQVAFLPAQAAALEVRAELTAAQDAFLATQQGFLVQGDVRVVTGAQAAFLATQQGSLTVRLELNAAQDAFLATQGATATVLASSSAAQSAFLPTQAGTLELLAQVTAAQNAFLATQSAVLTPVAPGITATQTAFLPTQQGTLVVRSEIAANQSAFLPTQASQIQHVSFLTSAQAAFLPTQSALVIRGTLPATSLEGVANVEAALAGRFDPIIDLEGRTIS